jgi:hypothetical protein
MYQISFDKEINNFAFYFIYFLWVLLINKIDCKNWWFFKQFFYFIILGNYGTSYHIISYFYILIYVIIYIYSGLSKDRYKI